MTEYNIFSDIKGALRSVWPFVFTIPFLIYVIPTSCWLIHESAMFIQKAIDYSYAKALIGAALVELGIVFLTVLPVGQNERGKGFIRLVLLGVALTVIVGSASKYAVSQYEAQDNIRQADKMKLAAMDSNIASLEKALESVNGQPTNSAIASRALQSAIKDRQEFVSGLDMDPRLVQSNDQKKWLAVLLRIVLQAVNLYILSALKKNIINEREKPQVYENTKETLNSAQGDRKPATHKKSLSVQKIKPGEAKPFVISFIEENHPGLAPARYKNGKIIVGQNGNSRDIGGGDSPLYAWKNTAEAIQAGKVQI